MFQTLSFQIPWKVINVQLIQIVTSNKVVKMENVSTTASAYYVQKKANAFMDLVCPLLKKINAQPMTNVSSNKSVKKANV